MGDYFKALITTARQRQDEAFAVWRASGYLDAKAHEAYLAAFAAADALGRDYRAHKRYGHD